MTRINATRRVRPAAEEEKVVEVASTDATVERTAAAGKPPAATVELVEGSTYEFRGVRFAHRRPVIVTDPRILSALSVNSRFRVTGAEGGVK
jgi:hypothetical protein